ncbi:MULTISPECIES: DUF4870 family protein [Acinetobacter]|uniref:Uncharacterized protein n=1 Tax=Acinetobacter haemolyticus TaxID=29430 RepID=A0A2K8PTS0_ACIHA|nr:MULTISPECIES: membrane protein [Acinetobacter]ATZ66086.1 hypothetical protein BSR56_01090 [Acinetobacter haemolyticus]MBN6533010.1 hypothetical protein [Acinetobacter pittii]MBO3656931.1 hypothetical protein [Acinetobacter haemolyticus]MCU4377336.1 hypothetical protein [Acinetobacter haemolyticus]NAR64842.1 hypothetical protein [Acinetobacter haemolyticus]
MNYSVDQDPNRTLTLILYVLYIIAIFTGGLLAIVALIINYVKRRDVQGSIFESHFTWQIRTFWWYLAWNIIAFIPFLFLFFTGDNPNVFAGVALSAVTFAFAVVFVAWIWIVYRAIRGLIALNDNKPMYS